MRRPILWLIAGLLITFPAYRLFQQPEITPSRPPDLDLLPTLEALLMEDIENCPLPCWWGFQLGETTLDEITSFVEQYEFDRSWRESELYSPYPLSNFIDGEGFSMQFQTLDRRGQPVLQNFSFSFSFDIEDRMRHVRVSFNHPNEWLIAEADGISFLRLLDQFEETPDVYLFENIRNLIPATEDSRAMIDSVNPRVTEQPIIVAFPSRGVMASYIFQLDFDLNDERSLDAETLRLCPDLDHLLNAEVRLGTVSTEPPNNEYYQLPEDVYEIGMNTEEFVEFFRENPADCIRLFKK
jgi:hypothetical protein